MGAWSKDFFISGNGSAVNNGILQLYIHKGTRKGDISDVDLFLDNKCRNDFADVRFHDNSGTELQFYMHSHGNYELIRDDPAMGKVNIISSDGTIYASHVGGVNGIYKSVDNGKNYTKIYSATEAHLLFIDSVGNIFACTSIGPSSGTHRLIRSDSTDAEHTTWTIVGPDMTASGGSIPHTAFCEDSSGNLYFGRYQYANAVAIYKSTDHGNNWSDITPAGYGAYQHVHGMYVDTYQTPEVIYAGLDAVTAIAIKSNNGGATWSTVTGTPPDGAFNQMLSGNGWRVLSGEAAVNGGGWSIFRSTDDMTWVPVLNTSQVMSGMQKINGNLYAFGANYSVNRYAQVYRSVDDGITWETVWIGAYRDGSDTSGGLRYATSPGTPNSSELQLLVGCLDSDTPKYHHNTRIFDGGDHYSGVFYVKIPSLPADGMVITVSGDTEETTSSSNKSIFAGFIGNGCFFGLNLNEGSGTVASDVSGNNRNATVSIGSGSFSSGISRAGWAFPFIIQENDKCINFNGDGHIRLNNSNTDPAFNFVKDFTYTCWIQLVNSNSTLMWVMGRGAIAGGSYPMALLLRSNGTEISFRYYNGSTITVEPTGANFRKNIITDGAPHFLAVTLDDSTPPKITFTMDNQSSDTVSLAATPLITVQNYFQIGRGSDNLQPFTGKIDSPSVYRPHLSQDAIRSIYESRNLYIPPLSVSHPLPKEGFGDLCLFDGTMPSLATSFDGLKQVQVWDGAPPSTEITEVLQGIV